MYQIPIYQILWSTLAFSIQPFILKEYSGFVTSLDQLQHNVVPHFSVKKGAKIIITVRPLLHCK